MQKIIIVIIICISLIGCNNHDNNEETTEVQNVLTAETTKEIETTKEKEIFLSRDKSTYTYDTTYEMLVRTPNDFLDSSVKFTGTISQIVGYDDEYDCFRMNVDDNSEYNLLVVYPKNIIDFNLLVNDNVTIYGGFIGMYTYETVLSNEITVPCVQAIMMDYNGKNTAINISVELPTCPLIVSEYDWNNEILGTIRIDDITVSYEKNWDGTYYVIFNIAGEKTYGNNGYVYINYKLYDSENYIVESGSFMTDKLSLGDKFKNMEETIYDLEPGTYRLEIVDYK